MKWDVYDELIDAVPADWVVEDCLVGLNWTLVRSCIGVGMSMTAKEAAGAIQEAGSIKGMSLRKLAEKAKSWNNLEASLGMAAINSVFNAPESVEANFDIPPIEHSGGMDTFERVRDEVRGKKVTVVGHFPNLDALGEVCELSILERNPQRGDFPDPACEYILGEQDYVFITGITMINKTLPRLLELCRSDAKITLVGPTVTLAPLWFEYGVSAFGGRVVFNPEVMFDQVREGGGHDRFGQCARMVQLYPEDVRKFLLLALSNKKKGK